MYVAVAEYDIDPSALWLCPVSISKWRGACGLADEEEVSKEKYDNASACPERPGRLSGYMSASQANNCRPGTSLPGSQQASRLCGASHALSHICGWPVPLVPWLLA
jgi:hypothetical protein